MKLGVVSNRYSDGNDGFSAIAAAAADLPDVLCETPDDLSALPRVLKDFAAAGVEVLAVDGGDGTVRDVLTALPASFGDAWPALALLPSGKTNLIARDVGGFGRGVEGLLRLRRRLAGGAVRAATRRTLEAVPAEGGATVRGMFCGAGVFTYATRMAGAWTYNRGIKQNAGVAVAMARTLWDSRRGREGEACIPMATAEEGAPLPAASPHFLLLATTLEKLMLGFWPFPRKGEGDLRWLAVAAPPRRLARALWAAWRGRPFAGPGYRSGRTGALSVSLSAPFVVDGEIFAPGETGVVLRAGPGVRFLSY
jgi:hypothetical protein